MTDAPSPFLVGTKLQVSWDSTSLGWLKTCPRLYEYSMVEGWRSRGDSVHLTFGLHYHAALELYDKLKVMGKSHDDALWDAVYDALVNTWTAEGPWRPDHNTKTRENLVRSIIWYLDNFADDVATTARLADGRPAVELSFKFELDFGPQKSYGAHHYSLCGHLDRVVDYLGHQYVMDRKTTGSTLSPHYFEGYDPDNQMSLYTIAAQIVFASPVKGVIIDAAQVLVGGTNFGRGITYRTPSQTAEWLADLRYWFRLAEGFATEGHWPMNDRACGMYGGCTFRKVCSKSPEVRQKFLESDFERRPWNPLQVR